MTVASNIAVYLVALAFFGIGGNGDEITDKVPYIQRCGTVTIFYGSGSDFWKIMVPVLVPTFEKLWFRFRFQLQLHI